MQPVRKVQAATHFKYLPPNPGSSMQRITPCLPGDDGALEMNWVDIPADAELVEPDLTYTDFVDAVSRAKKSTNQADITAHMQWSEEFGQEG